MTSRLLLLPLAMSVVVMSCSPVKDITNSKNTFEQQEIVINSQISWLEALNQPQNNYLIFIYSETCGHCHDMIDEIIDFAESGILPTYFINMQKYQIPISYEIKDNVSDINELSIKGTPTILEIENKVAMVNISGIDKCLTYLIDKRTI